jgi:hypothetical protein
MTENIIIRDNGVISTTVEVAVKVNLLNVKVKYQE